MKIFVHTFNTWFLAQLFHPFIFIIYFLLRNNLDSHDWAAAVFFISVFSFFASIPSLFFAWFLLYVITNSEFSSIEKYIAWMMSVVVTIFLNFIVLAFLFDFTISDEIGEIVPPSIIAATLSIVIRYKQFFSLQLIDKPVENENKLV